MLHNSRVAANHLILVQNYYELSYYCRNRAHRTHHFHLLHLLEMCREHAAMQQTGHRPRCPCHHCFSFRDPDRASRRSLRSTAGSMLAVPCVCLGPAAHCVAVLAGRCNGPVGKRDRRALFQKAGVTSPPAVITLEGFCTLPEYDLPVSLWMSCMVYSSWSAPCIAARRSASRRVSFVSCPPAVPFRNVKTSFATAKSDSSAYTQNVPSLLVFFWRCMKKRAAWLLIRS